MSEHARPDIVRELRAGTGAVQEVGRSLQAKPDRSEVVRWIVAAAIVAAVVSVIVSVPVAIAGARQGASTDVAQDARAAALEQAQADDRQRADEAYSAAQEANAELRQRGQTPVEVPKPDGPDGAQETLVAAAVAQTLAALPRQARGPTAAELGRAVAVYLSSNPAPGPSPRQIASAVAAWLRAHPPAPGRDGAAGQPGTGGQDGANGQDGAQGPEGPPGRPPTAEEIKEAVQAELANHPDVLCTTGGGTWRRLDNVVVDDEPGNPLNPSTTADLWACIA
jgi:hypothetical protein